MNTDHYHTPDEYSVSVAPRAARAPRKLRRDVLIAAKKDLASVRRRFDNPREEPLMTRFLRAASADEIDAFLRMPNPEKRAEYMNRLAARGDVRGLWKLLCAKGIADATLRERNAMNRFLKFPEASEKDLLSSERPPVSADQLLWSARAVVLRAVAKRYPPARTQSENVRFCQEAALVLRRLGI